MSNSQVEHFIGLDLAQPHEFTALAVLERPVVTRRTDFAMRRPAYALRHLDRFPLGTPYIVVIDRLRDLLRQEEIRDPVLMIDQTGVGRAVADMVLDGLQGHVTCSYFRVTLIAGCEASLPSPNDLHIPRVELVGVLQVLLQSRRLLVPRSLPNAALLVKELEQFKAKVTLKKDEVELWREGSNDDLVLSVALAAWLGEKALPGLYDVPEETTIRVIRT